MTSLAAARWRGGRPAADGRSKQRPYPGGGPLFCKSLYFTDAGTLRNADRMLIDRRKSVDYLLDPNHRDGRHEAFLVARLLGHDRTKVDVLIALIREGILLSPDRPKAVDHEGARFAVDLLLGARTGDRVMVRTG